MTLTKKEFDMQKKLIELQHSNKLNEIEQEELSKTRVQNLKHRNELEIGRIKSAEIRKNIDRRAARFEGYPK